MTELCHAVDSCWTIRYVLLCCTSFMEHFYWNPFLDIVRDGVAGRRKDPTAGLSGHAS